MEDNSPGSGLHQVTKAASKNDLFATAHKNKRHMKRLLLQ